MNANPTIDLKDWLDEKFVSISKRFDSLEENLKGVVFKKDLAKDLAPLQKFYGWFIYTALFGTLLSVILILAGYVASNAMKANLLMINEFLNKWNGKYCEVTGSANATNQCVDLANAYLRDVLKLPIVKWTNAIDFPSKLADSHDFIPNTPEGLPKEGDLVIWGKGVGHIGIFLSGNLSRFTSFDQNYPIGSPCHAQGHTYANVLGWLRCKIDVSDMPNYLEPLLRNDLGIDIKKPEGDVRSRVGEIKDGIRNDASQKSTIKKLEGDLKELSGEVGKFEKGLELAVKSRDKFEKELGEVKAMVVTRDKEINKLNEDMKTLKESIDPSTQVVIDKEKLDKLMERKPLEAHTNRELIQAVVRRYLVKAQAFKKEWFNTEKR